MLIKYLSIFSSLNEDSLEQLPCISRNAKNEIEHWRDYIYWKRTILQENIEGIRFDMSEYNHEHSDQHLLGTYSNSHMPSTQTSGGGSGSGQGCVHGPIKCSGSRLAKHA